MSFLDSILGSYSDIEVKKINKIVNKVIENSNYCENLSDNEIQNKKGEFEYRYEKGESLTSILPEAFAVCREASNRSLGMKHYEEQLIAGVVLTEGRIAEMRTGEGKTLVATLPAYLNSITKKGVHIVTTNAYLAQRDKESMEPLYNMLGLKVGLAIDGLNEIQKKEAYNADITYGTNNEFGFDYLKDNLVKNKQSKVQRGLNFAIIDEVDSVLIDEARTPLIISGQGEKASEIYTQANIFTASLTSDDYRIDKKAQVAMLMESGVEKAEKFFNLSNYADLSNLEIQHSIVQLLKARYIMKKNKDYIVKDDQVMIVDSFTGRVMDGRRYSDGLHQAIELKESVTVNCENKTLASITFQNYFRMYAKISGMSGSALLEESEFKEIYRLDVVVIPTHKKIKRIDCMDEIFISKKDKYNAIVKEVKDTIIKKQPILIGTECIYDTEELEYLLTKEGIEGIQVLNAKKHREEANIISNAGNLGMITIATNMAGRGTDIKLGDGVAEVGGLKVIGSQRHESRRIDTQLRGRSGRQGDPGETKFYISLEDELISRFLDDKWKSHIEKINVTNGDLIGEDKKIGKILLKAIENAQKKVEGDNFEARKTLIGYDDVIAVQRSLIYKERDKVLNGVDIDNQVRVMIEEVVKESIEMHLENKESFSETDAYELIQYLKNICLPNIELDVEEIMQMNMDDIEVSLINLVKSVYVAKTNLFPKSIINKIEEQILLMVVDQKWAMHLEVMESLKKEVSLMSYKQQNPLQAYQIESSILFEEMIEKIKLETVRLLFHIEINLD